MGTRASFFIGNPEDLENRKWLGCIAWDGHADNFEKLVHATDAESFAGLVADEVSGRDVFCDPAKHGFPFPWSYDLYLTDSTFAFFDGAVRWTSFHRGWIKLADYLSDEALREVYYDQQEQLPGNVLAPAGYDRSAPDSIMVFSSKGIR